MACGVLYTQLVLVYTVSGSHCLYKDEALFRFWDVAMLYDVWGIKPQEQTNLYRSIGSATSDVYILFLLVLVM